MVPLTRVEEVGVGGHGAAEALLYPQMWGTGSPGMTGLSHEIARHGSGSEAYS